MIVKNSIPCSVTSKSFGFGSAYTITIDEVSCQCCWMDNTEANFMPTFSLIKKTKKQNTCRLSLLPLILHMTEFWYVKWLFKNNDGYDGDIMQELRSSLMALNL